MKLQPLLLLLLGLFLALPSVLHAQMGFNSPSGVTPKLDIDMYSRNGFIVHQKYVPTTDPISGTYTLSCTTNPAPLTTTAGVLKSPGSRGGLTYPASSTCQQLITVLPQSNTIGFEVTFDFLDTEAAGDSVIIADYYGGRVAFSGTATPPVLFIPGAGFQVTLKSDADANTGNGFQLRWRKVMGDPAGSPVSAGALQFDVTKAALLSGNFGIGAMQLAGAGSTALGSSNLASGDDAVAIGFNNVASGALSFVAGNNNEASGYNSMVLGGNSTALGNYAIALGGPNSVTGQAAIAIGGHNKISAGDAYALGDGNTVSNENSLALGVSNQITGEYATALGYFNKVAGNYAIGIGNQTAANGANSMALGNLVSTNGFSGAMILGDASAFNSTSATAQNQFTSRFAGGYRLFSNSAITIGVQLAAGGNAWSAISDSAKKERFLPLNHTDLLTKIRTLKLGTWNYKGQRDQRHYGPMAQDFFARFGHDALGVIGCDTLLNSHDFTAVTLSGVQALALENEQLKAEIVELKQQALRTQKEQLQTAARLDAIERRVLMQPAPRTTLTTRRKQTRQF